MDENVKKVTSILYIDDKIVETFHHNGGSEWVEYMQKMRDKYPQDKYDYSKMKYNCFSTCGEFNGTDGTFNKETSNAN